MQHVLPVVRGAHQLFQVDRSASGLRGQHKFFAHPVRARSGCLAMLLIESLCGVQKESTNGDMLDKLLCYLTASFSAHLAWCAFVRRSRARLTCMFALCCVAGIT
jgi:hypothetical protein